MKKIMDSKTDVVEIVGIGSVMVERLEHAVQMGAFKLFKDGDWAFVGYPDYKGNRSVMKYNPGQVMSYLAGRIDTLELDIVKSKKEEKDDIADDFMDRF